MHRVAEKSKSILTIVTDNKMRSNKVHPIVQEAGPIVECCEPRVCEDACENAACIVCLPCSALSFLSLSVQLSVR